MDVNENLARIMNTTDDFKNYSQPPRVFLVDNETLNTVLQMDNFCNRKVLVVNSQDIADEYTLKALTPKTSVPDMQDGYFYVLETRLMKKPQDFTCKFTIFRFYPKRYETTSRVLVLADHYYTGGFEHTDKLDWIVKDLTKQSWY
jgi:hypothetical protein